MYNKRHAHWRASLSLFPYLQLRLPSLYLGKLLGGGLWPSLVHIEVIPVQYRLKAHI